MSKLARFRPHRMLRIPRRRFCYQAELEKQLAAAQKEVADLKNTSGTRGHRHLSNVWEATETEKLYFTAGICGTSTAFIVALGNVATITQAAYLVGSFVLGGVV